uniref:Retrotransposon gag domain-containing protein n=1 Tax=Tanacetum cinerariifolium TaxID=118510 RepID=A0A699H1C4_TANCI|nr:hypothetical protein [Tanacetum cinerariifolium]
MRELREDTFFENKNDDALEHVELPRGTVDCWDLLKKAFIQRYCPPSKTTKQLKEIRNFKQEEDETLYQAWECETMILGRPFLATIHAKIDVFNKEISLGIGGDRVTFDMDKKIHNFTTLIGEIYMINATSNTPSYTSSRVEETNDVHNDYNQEQGQSQLTDALPMGGENGSRFRDMIRKEVDGGRSVHQKA